MQRLDSKICLNMLKLGSPAAISKGSNAAGGMIINNLLTSYDMPYLVAAYGVFAQITIYIRAAWFSSSTNLIVFSGIFIGEEDKNSLKEVQKIALVHALICSTFIAFCFSFLRSRLQKFS